MNTFVAVVQFKYWKDISTFHDRYSWDGNKYTEKIKFKSSVTKYGQLDDEILSKILNNKEKFAFTKEYPIINMYSEKEDTSEKGEGFRVRIKKMYLMNSSGTYERIFTPENLFILE